MRPASGSILRLRRREIHRRNGRSRPSWQTQFCQQIGLIRARGPHGETQCRPHADHGVESLLEQAAPKRSLQPLPRRPRSEITEVAAMSRSNRLISNDQAAIWEPRRDHVEATEPSGSDGGLLSPLKPSQSYRTDSLLDQMAMPATPRTTPARRASKLVCWVPTTHRKHFIHR